MEDLLNMIENVGFPITVSVYLLIRVENKLNDLTEAIGDLREAIITMPKTNCWQPGSQTHEPHRGNGKASDEYV
ncbi:MAG: YvrJ family protein [Bacillota bacterium]|nr:YvrJ family protein [Bacillota bacterium]MEA1960507.1 YvrJ family protein [Bacillota bacterium]